jgi:hypothetical protein
MGRPVQTLAGMQDGEYEGPCDGERQVIADGNHFRAEGPLVDQEGWAVQNADLVELNVAVWKLE